MGVETKHPEYDATEDIWDQLRDQDRGENGVKDATHGRDMRHLPPVSRIQIDRNEYAPYKARAEYVDFLGRTLSGLVGAVMQKSPDVAGVPDEYLDNIDNAGTPLELFAKETLRDTLLMGRTGVLADRPAEENGRSYFVRYAAEQITSWETTMINSMSTLSRVVLKQSELRRTDEDEFAYEMVEFYRVLELVDGRYQQSIWVPDGTQARNFTQGEVIVPQPARGPVAEIPFVFIGATSMAPSVESPPVLPLANVNLHHYRLSADLRDALFKTTKPKLILTTNKEVKEITFDDKALTLEPGDDASFIAYEGGGLDQIRAEMAADESRMVVLGARLLEGQKRAAETAEALRLRSSGEQATLHDVVDTVSLAIERHLQTIALWDGFASPDEVSFSLNRDFHGLMPTPEEITSRLDAVSDPNGPTLEDHHMWLYRQGLTSERDFDVWVEKKGSEAPPPPPIVVEPEPTLPAEPEAA